MNTGRILTGLLCSLRRSLLWSLLALLIGMGSVAAQGGGTTATGVYVTTQDYLSLRAGPGLHFERIAVLDPAVTLPAIGRSVNTDWIQVDLGGQTGWLATRFLVWSGDVVQLPVDGLSPTAFLRRAGVTGVTTRETPIYRRHITPLDQVGVLPAGTPVEVTGRLGERGFFRYQILYEGKLYWVGAWNIRITGGYYLNVFDTAYLYPYGRLVTIFARDITNASRRLSQIESFWQRLDSGQRVSCRTIPAYVSRDTTDIDVRQEPKFAPAVHAFDTAAAHINAVISAFEDACSRARAGEYVTQDEVDYALERAAEARRNLVLSSSLLVSLQARNPLLNPD